MSSHKDMRLTLTGKNYCRSSVSTTKMYSTWSRVPDQVPKLWSPKKAKSMMHKCPLASTIVSDMYIGFNANNEQTQWICTFICCGIWHFSVFTSVCLLLYLDGGMRLDSYAKQAITTHWMPKSVLRFSFSCKCNTVANKLGYLYSGSFNLMMFYVEKTL